MQKKIAFAWSVKKKKIASARSDNLRHASSSKPMPQKHGRTTTLLSRDFVTALGSSENSDSREPKK
jgi:hypothetical protein